MKNLKTISTLILFMFGNIISNAQEGVQLTEPSPFLWAYNNIFLILGAVVVFAVIYSLLRLGFDLLAMQKAELMKDLGMEKEEIVKELGQPTWKKMYDWAWSIVPEGHEEDIDMGHDYDGIRELDNKLPPWWLVLFYGTIVFAVVYMWVYHSPGNEWSSEQEYLIAMEEAEESKKAHLALSADAIDETTVTLLVDEKSIARGSDIYFALCAVCHGQQGEGLVGPNFADPYWVNGGDIKDLFSTIKYGVPEKGMISWRSQLRPSEMQSVSSYILTLQGTNPPNPKAPEGELWEGDGSNTSEEAKDESNSSSEI